MSRIENAFRLKRFKVKADVEVSLIIETQFGKQLKFQLQDASYLGIAVKTVSSHEDVNDIQEGQIIPESKVAWGNQSCTLGRLVVKRIVSAPDGSLLIGFTCIDGKVPLFGNFSRCFEDLPLGTESPLDFEIGSKKFSLATYAESEFQHPDLFEKCRQFKYMHGDLRKNPLYQYYSIKQSVKGSRALYKLSSSSRRLECVSFASYDYLGFSQHEAVIDAAKAAIDKYGVSATGTMILAGKSDLHEELERKIAKFFDREDALLYTTGFATNVGLVTGIVRPQDLVVADIYSHASLHDGISSSRAKARFFKHNSMQNMEKILEEHRDAFHGCLVISEGLFSMEGTTPDMNELVTIAKRYNARVFVDECHSIGVYGKFGRGVSERDGVLDDIDIYMGSFSKGLGGGAGGFITASKEVIEWLRFFSRPGMFSAALPPPIVGAAIKILDLIQEMPERRQKLKDNISRFRTGLKKLGLKCDADPESPIIPVVIGDIELMGKMNNVLLENGVFVNCIMFPAVPMESSRFRFSLTALHNDSDIDLALFALQRAVEKNSTIEKIKAKDLKLAS